MEAVPCPDRYDDVICQAADFVQQTRGRPFKEFPNIELLDDAEFDLALVEDLDESADDLLEDERLLKALGLLPVELDLFETFEALIQSGAVGFYDPEDGRLVVRGGQFDLYGQAILVHELVHAFDDQWFDLGREFGDDAGYGFLAVIEGNATRVENLWRSQLSAEDMAQLRQEEMGALSAEDFELLLSLPEVLIALQIWPYADGEVYVSALERRGGEAAIDERLVDPPASSEQVLHPDGPAAGLVVIDVDPPAVDGPVLDEGTAGELLVEQWLGERASFGWGGDHYVIWESGARTCLTIDLAADSASDSTDIFAAAERWADERPADRQVEIRESVARSTVRVNSCY